MLKCGDVTAAHHGGLRPVLRVVGALGDEDVALQEGAQRLSSAQQEVVIQGY